MTAFDNRQKTVVLNHVVANSGNFPSGAGGTGSDIGLGAIRTFGFGFEPNNGLDTDGQLVAIFSNTALFSLFGTNFGGDGRTTFGLPNLEDRLMIGAGTIPDGPTRSTGGFAGDNTQTIVTSNLEGAPAVSPLTNTQASQAVTYAINTGGTLGGADHGFLGQVGTFGISSDPGLPRGWVKAEGQVLLIAQNTALFSVLGTTYGGDGETTFALPDFRGKVAVGVDDTDPDFALGPVGTSNDLFLTQANYPTELGGAGEPISNLQPSQAVRFLMKTDDGIFPSQGSGMLSGSIPYLGEIVMFAGLTIPTGWTELTGQLLQISSNNALFSLLRTNYGGDGETTFALPDLRGAAITDNSAANPVGTVLGANELALTVENFANAPEAQSLVVTTALDVVDAMDYQTSLREAIDFANSNADASTITFDDDLADQVLTLTGGQMTITTDITLESDGPGGSTQGITIDADGQSRIFDVRGMETELTVRGLTLTNGDAGASFGGAIFADPETTVNIVSSTVSDSAASYGGGIYARGAFNAVNATFSGNSASQTGGALYLSGETDLTGVTVSGNTADSNAAGILARGPLDIASSTIAENAAAGAGATAGGLVFTGSENLSIFNSIIADNTVAGGSYGDISGVIYSSSNNAIGAAVALGPLADNGGPVRTHLLDAASPLADSGTVAFLPEDIFDVDGDGDVTERLPLAANGLSRQFGQLDLGAAELRGPLVVTSLADGNDGDFGPGELTLREALSLAQNGETITFDTSLSDQIIYLDSVLVIDTPNLTIDGNIDGDAGGRADITISGDTGQNDTTVTAPGGYLITDAFNNTNTADNTRIFDIGVNQNGTVLKSLILTGGVTDANRTAAVVTANSDMTIQSSVLAGNASTASFGASAVFTRLDDITIADTSIHGNSSTDATATTPSGSLTFTNSTLSNNDNRYTLYTYDGTVNIRNSTLSHGDEGSGAHFRGDYYDDEGVIDRGTLNVTSSILDSGSDAAVDLRGGAAFSGGGNVISNGGGDITAQGTDVIGTDAAPVVAGLSALADNGGAGATQKLEAGSAAIGIGAAPLALTTDAVGNGRNINGVDAGAVEFTGALVVDTLSDVDDGDVSAGNLSLREALALVDEGGTITFDASLMGGTINLQSALVLTSNDLTINGNIDGDAAGRADIILSGDANGDDATKTAPGGYTITDRANNANDADNVRILYGNGRDITLESLIFTGGSSPNDGGALQDGGAVTIRDSVFAGNQSNDDGGAIELRSASTVQNSSFFENHAGRDGGAIYTTAELTVSQSTFSGNSADDGSAIYIYSDAATISNSTFVGNTGFGTLFGYGYSTYEDEPFNFSLTSNIIVGFLAGRGPGEFTSGGGNVITGGTAGLDPVGSDQFGSGLTLAVGPLADNGGPGATHGIGLGSVALGIGVNPGGLTLDQTGQARDQNGIDSGAVEAESILVEAPLVIVTTLDDTQNGDLSAGDISLREALTLVSDGGTITFDAALAGGVIRLSDAFGSLSIDREIDVTIDGSAGQANGAIGITLTGDVAGDDTTRTDSFGRVLTDATVNTNTGDNVRVFDQNEGGDITLASLAITGGVTSEDGGGIRFSKSGGDASLTLNSVSVSGNTGFYGGGLEFFQNGGNLYVNDSTFSHNVATAQGGAIYHNNTKSAAGASIITNSTFAYNSAAGQGGAINNYDGELQIFNSTVTQNTGGDVGGVWSYGDTVTDTYLASTIIAGNTGGDIGLYAEETVPFLSGGNNIIGVNPVLGAGTILDAQASDQTGTAAAPLDAGFDSFGNYGGTTEVFDLLYSSIARGNGSNPQELLFDQTGGLRFRDGVPGPFDVGAAQDDDDFGASILEAGFATIGGPFRSDLRSADDTDWIGIDLDAGITYQVVVSGSETLPGLADFPLLQGIYNADGNLISDTTGTPSVAGTSTLSTGFVFSATGERVFIEVGRDAGDIGEYNVEVFAAPAPIANINVSGDVIEGVYYTLAEAVANANPNGNTSITMSNPQTYRAGPETVDVTRDTFDIILDTQEETTFNLIAELEFEFFVTSTGPVAVISNDLAHEYIPDAAQTFTFDGGGGDDGLFTNAQSSFSADGGADVDTLHTDESGPAIWARFDQAGPNVWTQDDDNATDDPSSPNWRALGTAQNFEVFEGTFGSDLFAGGAEDNRYIYSHLQETSGNLDVVIGGGGSDTLDLSLFGGGTWTRLDIAAPSTWTQDDGDATDEPSSPNWRQIVDLNGVENVIGTNFSDLFAGNSQDNHYTYTGFGIRGGRDEFIGQGGRDTIDFSRFDSGIWANFTFAGTKIWTQGDDDATDQPASPNWREIADVSGVEDLVGTQQSDFFSGTSEDNTYVYTTGGLETGGRDVIVGRGGVDTVDYSGAAFGVWVRLEEAGTQAWTQDDDNATDEPASPNWREIGELSGIERIIGTNQSDLFAGNGEDNTYVYIAETLGSGGLDVIRGQGGTNTVDYSQAAFAVWVRLDLETTQAWTQDDSNATDQPSSPNWREIGNLLDIDNIIGTQFQDFIVGNDDDNEIVLGGGADVVQGKAGNDTFVFSDTSSGTIVTDFDDGGLDFFEDILDFSQVSAVESFANLGFSEIEGNTVVSYGDDFITLQGRTGLTLEADDFIFV